MCLSPTIYIRLHFNNNLDPLQHWTHPIEQPTWARDCLFLASPYSTNKRLISPQKMYLALPVAIWAHTYIERATIIPPPGCPSADLLQQNQPFLWTYIIYHHQPPIPTFLNGPGTTALFHLTINQSGPPPLLTTWLQHISLITSCST